MEKEIISKEELDWLMKVKGKVKGLGLRGDADFIREREGEEGLCRLEKAMADLGHPFSYQNIKIMDFYPLSLAGLGLLLSKRLFGFSNQDFEKSGELQVKGSFVPRFFLRYLTSAETAVNNAPTLWNRNYSVGRLDVVSFEKDKGETTFKIYDFKAHPLHLYVAKGYIRAAAELTLGKKVDCEMVEPGPGDLFICEYRLTWEP